MLSNECVHSNKGSVSWKIPPRLTSILSYLSKKVKRLWIKYKKLKNQEDKDRFRKHIMQRNKKEDFANFKPLFDKIDDIINNKK